MILRPKYTHMCGRFGFVVVVVITIGQQHLGGRRRSGPSLDELLRLTIDGDISRLHFVAGEGGVLGELLLPLLLDLFVEPLLCFIAQIQQFITFGFLDFKALLSNKEREREREACI